MQRISEPGKSKAENQGPKGKQKRRRNGEARHKGRGSPGAPPQAGPRRNQPQHPKGPRGSRPRGKAREEANPGNNTHTAGKSGSQTMNPALIAKERKLQLKARGKLKN